MIKQLMRRVAVAFAVLALCLPIGLMFVYLLFPLWKWLEETFGIESVGHGAPAAWCYVAVYLALVVAATVMIWVANRRRGESGPRPS